MTDNQSIRKDKEWLESKWWYRTLTILYVTAYILAGVTVLVWAYTNLPEVRYSGIISGSWYLVIRTVTIGGIFTFLFFEIIKRVFFYIVIHRSFIYGLNINWKKVVPFLAAVSAIGIFAFYFYIQHQNRLAIENNKAEEAMRMQYMEEKRKADEAELENWKIRIEEREKEQEKAAITIQEKQRADEALQLQRTEDERNANLARIEAEEAMRMQQMEEKKIADIATQAIQEKERKQNAVRMQSCLSIAESEYNKDLKQGCITLSKAVERDYKLCAFTSALSEHCRNLYPAVEANCDLSQLASFSWESQSLIAHTLLQKIRESNVQRRRNCEP